jgi:hypothetical protein
MSRRPVPNAGTAVSLFPFLAVLLCTIGSLLLLLVVIARQSRSDAEQAIAQAKAKPAVDMAEVERQREDLDWQVEQLNASRDRTVEVLAQQRSHLSHLEEHSQRLRAEIKEWENAERQLAERTTLDAAAQERLKAELAELQKLKAEAEAKLTDVKGRVKRTAFAVVPYEGSNGTKRRPIYIECRGDSITIQPEGIVFTEADFGGSLGPSNPLAACVRATAEHYARMGSLEPGEQPYPLLLVRPDGVMAYYVARAAMSSWDSEFGYELVDAEWELDYPRVDPQLQKLLAATQIEARRRQEMIARATPSIRPTDRVSFRAPAEGEGSEDLAGVGGSGTGDGSSSSRRNGGNGSGGNGQGVAAPYVPARGYIAESGVVGVPVGSGGVSGSNGQGVGLGGLPTGSGGGMAGQPYGPVGAPGGSPVGGNGQPGQPGAVPQGPQLFAPGGMNGVAGSGGGYPSTGTGTPGGNGQGGTNGSAGSQDGSGNGNGGSGTATNGGNGAANGNPAQNQNGGGRYSPNGVATDPNAPYQGGSSSSDSLVVSADPSQSGFGQPGMAGSSGGGSGSSGGGSSSGGSGGGGSSGGSSGGGAGGSGGSGGSSGGQSGGGASAGQIQDVSMVDDRRSGGDDSVESLASKRGKDWSLPDAARKATPVTRPVQLLCSNEHLTVFSIRNLPDKQINFGPRTADSVDELVRTIWAQVDTWGLAGRGMYWRPTLSIHYAPDGAQRFEELRRLLSNSGLEVTGKTISVAGPASNVQLR